MATLMPCQLDSYQRTLRANVITCDPLQSLHKLCSPSSRCPSRTPRWLITLDRSPLYPEGGGQPSDTGSIRLLSPGQPDDVWSEPTLEDCTKSGPAVDVLDVSRRDGAIEHVVTAPLLPRTSVLVSVDWDRRYDHMQQHTGAARRWTDLCSACHAFFHECETERRAFTCALQLRVNRCSHAVQGNTCSAPCALRSPALPL